MRENDNVRLARQVVRFLFSTTCTITFIIFILSIVAAALGANGAGSRDSIEYWASATQFVHHANPYEQGAISAREHAAGLSTSVPALVMGNAPPSMILVAPLGFMGPRGAEFLWLAALLACFVCTVRIVLAMQPCAPDQVQIVAYTFAPALLCLAAGQSSLWILLGVALFIRFFESKPFLAGICLWFCALKPQLFIPFALVLILWVKAARANRILFGAVAATAVTSIAVTMVNPKIWSQYHTMMSASRYDRAVIPCPSVVLRTLISPDAVWPQYIPVTIGCIWAIWYFRRHRATWNWSSHGTLLLLVSVLVAPYSWIVDQAVVLVSLLCGIRAAQSEFAMGLLILGSTVIELGVICGKDPMHSMAYIWSAPAWLLWYLYATRANPKLTGIDTTGLSSSLASH